MVLLRYRHLWPFLATSLTAAFVLSGCTAAFYRKQADKDVYKILAKVEQDIFGESSEFTIETAYTGRKPNEIKPQEILEERSVHEKIVLPLDEALDYAVSRSRVFQSEKEQLYLTALNLTDERHSFFPQLFANSRATGTRQTNGEKLGTVSSDIGFTQALVTGANLSVAIANDLLRYYTGDPRKSAVSVISASLAQPLLRGAGRKIAAERLKQSHRDVFYAVRDFNHFQNTFAVDVVIDYFRLLQLKDTIYNEYSNYLSRKGFTEYLRARSVDRARPEQVAESEQSELQAKNRYINSIARFRNALDRFKITLGMPQTTDLRLVDEEITTLRQKGPTRTYLGSDQGFRIALEHRLPLLNEIDAFEDRKRQVAVAADRLKAELNILADASLESDDKPTRYERFNFNDVRANVGVQLNLPFDRLRERNTYRTVLVQFESAIRTLGLTFDELRNTIDQGIRELEQFRQNYEIQKNAVALAANRVEGNQLRLQAGTVIFRDLNESQDALIAAQNAATAALVDYLEVRLDLLATLGILQTEQNRFWLEAKPSKVDLTTPPASADALAQPAETTSDQVIPPDRLFNND